MGATVGPVDTDRFAADLKGLWGKFNSLDPEAMLAAGGMGDGASTSASAGTRRGGGRKGKVLDQKAEQEATGFLLDLVSVSEANGLKLPRGEMSSCASWGFLYSCTDEVERTCMTSLSATVINFLANMLKLVL